LDRTSIEKSDFPTSRRGYDPAAVDAHLKALADHFEELVGAVPSEPVASEASARVREIVAAAESSAAEIRRAAEQQATESARQAAAEAASVRQEATRRAEECVTRVREATSVMLEHLEAMESELESLVGGLREGGESRRSPVAAGSAPTGTEREPPARVAPAEAPPTAAARSTDDAGPAADRTAPARSATGSEHEAPADRDAMGEAVTGSEREAQTDRTSTGAAGGDEEKARVIALEMALSGKSREEADGYLAGEFNLEDRAKLLDEIYAKIGENER